MKKILLLKLSTGKHLKLKHSNIDMIKCVKCLFFRLKSYDDPLESPNFVLRLSEVQTIATNVLYQPDHFMNIVLLNVKKIIEFIK